MVDSAKFWDKAARKYASQAVGDEAGYQRTLEATRALLNKSQSVLEAGCGTGSTALVLAEHAGNYLATDISGEMIAIANEKLAGSHIENLKFEQMDIFDSRLATESFEVIQAHNLVHLVPDVDAFYGRVAELLKPGGLFISKTGILGQTAQFLIVPIKIMQLFGKAPEVKMLTIDKLTQIASNHGLETLSVEDHASNKKGMSRYIVAKLA
jgi:ubiquinone/menaquinone biosynthesis C-methylase UbiE